jgi:hypothetical protein
MNGIQTIAIKAALSARYDYQSFTAHPTALSFRGTTPAFFRSQ